jgi:SAM-dependent methyltransferase
MTDLAARVASHALRTRLAEIFEDDPGTQVLSWMLGPSGMLLWAQSVALASNPELRECIPPIPPPDLRGITASPEEAIFLWSGLVDLDQFLDIYERVRSTASNEQTRVLDFACGCGRLSRYLNELDAVEAVGLDANPRLVAWCQDNLTRVRTLINPLQPPMPLPDASIDLAYSLSLFTHLSEDATNQWFADLARVLVAGATLLVTTHGVQALSIIRGSSVHRELFDLDEAAADDLINRLPNEGFLYRKCTPDVLAMANVGSDYGYSFIDEKYVASRWNDENFEVIEHLAGGLRGWQDIVVLRRR